MAAHSVYELTKYTDVIQAFNIFGAALKAEATAANAWIPQTRLQTTQYWIRGVKDAGKNTDFTDLGEFAQRIARNSNASATLSSAASSLTTTIQSLVVAKVQGTLRTNALGLSVYYPTGGSTTNQTYLDLSLSKLEGASWPAYLAVVQANANGTAPTLEVTADGSTNLTASLDQPATVRVLLSNTTNAYSYRAVVVKSDIAGDSNAVLYLGEVTLGSTQGASAVAFAWDGRLPSLSAGAGSPAIPFGGFFDEVDPSVLTAYARYTPPASTNTELVILLAQMGSDGSWQVTDSLDASGAAENMAPRGVKLQAGGTLTPLYYLEYRVGTDPEQWTGDYSPAAQSVIIPASRLSGLTLALSPLPPATYTVEVEVLDCYGDTSDPVDFAITAQTSTLPSLQIAPSTSGHVQLSWPVNPAGFVLQSASALKAGGWTDVSLAGLTTDGTNNKLIEAETGSAQFYRLVKP